MKVWIRDCVRVVTWDPTAKIRGKNVGVLGVVYLSLSMFERITAALGCRCLIALDYHSSSDLSRTRWVRFHGVLVEQDVGFIEISLLVLRV